MKTKLTKKQEGMLWTHEHSNITEFSQLYNRCSYNKQLASYQCERDYIEHSGFNKRYHSANSHFFSFSFKYVEGNKVHLRYHTAYNVYDFIIDDEFVKVV